MHVVAWSVVALTLLLSNVAWSADAVTKASVKQQEIGNQMASIWITGRGFQAGAMVTISGGGITERAAPTVIPEAMRRDGGSGDGIIYNFSIDANAQPGLRDITVTDNGGTATGSQILELVPGNGMPANMPQQGNGEMDPMNNGNNPPPQGNGGIDTVTRASPYYVEQGTQANIWIVGKGFEPGARPTFSNQGITPALDGQNQPLPIEVYKNIPSEAGNFDGLQYFAIIGSAQEAPAGVVNVTVTNPNGSTLTGQMLMEIVPQGALPERRPGDGSIDAITGASPQTVYAGKKVAFWIWGEGITTGAQVSYSNPGIREFRPSEVVEVSQSHPGYSGIRNFLEIDPQAMTGPVAITIRNPNGTSQMLQAAFQIAPDNGEFVPGDQGGGQANCPDLTTTVTGITSVNPTIFPQGQMVNLVVQGLSFGCGCQLQISGGGIQAVDQPTLTRNPLNPFQTTLTWNLYVQPDAPPGPRDITVVNANNSSQVASQVIQVVGDNPGASPPINQSVMTMGQAANGAGQNAMMAEEPSEVRCQQQPGRRTAPIVTLILAALLLIQRSFMKARRTS